MPKQRSQPPASRGDSRRSGSPRPASPAAADRPAAPVAEPDGRLARTALVAAVLGWVLIAVAAVVAATRTGPVPQEVASDAASTAVGLIGLVGAIGLVAGMGRGVMALSRIRAGQATGRASARWAVALGAAPFVVVLGLGVLTLLTHG
ncbi:hypothetical protein [Cellulomonas citrea]|uniref:hypothetical protein n=1 Tax=Cellulomonas citrea TaxID=1909423 RepID=UPI00135A14A3|nr:hypothetical protein [Cellulomonas citrea]